MDIIPPPSPAPGPPPPFPVLGVAAPLVVSIAVWAITQSPYALLFAALGPVVAVAGVADQRITGRRLARRAARERREGLDRLHGEVRARVAAGRAALVARAPSARDILDGHVNPALLWRADPGRDGGCPAPVITLGLGTVRSGLTWRGEGDSVREDAVACGSGRRGRRWLLDRLVGRRDACAAPSIGARSWAELVEWIPDAPVLVSAAGGVGLCGPWSRVEPVLRGIVVQLVHALPPDDLRILSRPPGAPWDWLVRLPHAAETLAAGSEPERPAGAGRPAGASAETDDALIRLLVGGREIVLAASARVEALPAACRTVLEVCTPVSARILAADPAPGTSVGRPDAGGVVPAARGVRPRAAMRTASPDDEGEAVVGTVVPVARGGRLQPELVSRGEVERFADELAAHAARRGLAAARAPLPACVPFAELPAPGSESGPRSLAAVVGVGHDGPVVLDLVSDGPHAVVAGTTGSGKSELLVTWMAAIAAAHPPEAVTVLLVDFKGGAAFDPLLVLPHAVGLVTDLDGVGARRAFESLRAEIRHRERTLREAGARDIDDPAAAGALPRLVIVVDELAALLADQDGLHDVVADIAARGRSLGMHLVLCTQRPAGVVRDSVLANCDLRLSLRVNNEADSRALLGTPEAAHLTAAPAGRCLLGDHGAPARPFQVAVTSGDDLARIAAARPPLARVRRPWLDPLPAFVQLRALAETRPASPAADVPLAIPFALVDLPDEQRRETALWRPALDGHLVVVGGPGSGRTACLATLAASARLEGSEVRQVPPDAEGCWDALAGVVERIRRPSCARDESMRSPLVVVADDLDVAVSRLQPDHQAALLDLVAVIAREGPQAGVALAVSSRRPGGMLQAVTAAAGQPVVLGLPSRQEHVLAGGTSDLYDPASPPGAGEWRGRRIQVALATDAPPAPTESALVEPAPPLELDPGAVHALVTPSPGDAIARLSRLGFSVTDATGLPVGWSPAPASEPHPGAAGPRIVVGDPDTWLLRGPLLAQLGRTGHVILDGCTLRDVRMLLRTRAVPPPLAPVAGRVWCAAPDGGIRRRSWPAAPAVVSR